MKNNYDLGKRLRQLRTQRGMSQEQVANNAEITPAYYGQVERGIKNISVRRLEKICDALDVSLGEVFADSIPEKEKEQDEISNQILFQLHGRSDYEKQSILKIIKQIFSMTKQREK